MSHKVILLNKPYQVLCKFTDREGRATLADYVDVSDIYPAGRLDADSEGLVVLTNWGRLQTVISDPKHKLPKTYWVQVEGVPGEQDLLMLEQGVKIKGGLTKPARAERIPAPDVWPRVPPIRERKSVPDSWISLTLTEGRNRQVRRMTAAVGFPTLRLIRYAVGPWSLDGLLPGEWQALENPDDWLKRLLRGG